MRIKALASAVLFSASAVFAAEKGEDVLRRSLQTPNTPYHGQMIVTHWYGPHTKSEEVNVRFDPPSTFRWDYISPNGAVIRIIQTDGKTERVYLPDQKKVLTGGAAKSVEKKISADDEWTLLEKNYFIVLKNPVKLIGRAADVLQLEPKSEGKLRQTLWIDKESGVILQNKRYRSKGNYVVVSRFIEFDSGKNKTAEPLPTATGEEDHDFAPDFMTRDQWKEKTHRTTSLPDALTTGFVFESADTFLVDGRPVDHFRYTDGLTSLSIFQTSKPVRLRSSHPRLPAGPTAGPMLINEMGHVARANVGGRYYTAMADVSEELLRRILDSLK